MSSKRNLKKLVRCMCGDMAAECIIAKTVVPGIDPDVMSALVIKIACLQDQTLRKFTFCYDKVSADFESPAAYRKARHEYMVRAYRSIKTEFNKQVDDIVKEMNAALPQAQKELNRQNVHTIS